MISRAVLGLTVILGGALVLGAHPVEAGDISFESRTYVPARGTDGENSHVLIYEYVAVDTEDALLPGLYLRAGGWGRADLADETFGRKTNGELQYAFLGWRAAQLNAEVRAGRISVTAGAARYEVLDGLQLGSDLPAGFDVLVYGGIPVEIDENSRSKDRLFGARVSQGVSGLYRLGLSYLKEQDNGTTIREEVGSDLFFAPLSLVRITGTSLYNVINDQPSRHDYRLTLVPFGRVRLVATWEETDYRHYFQAPKNPALEPIHNERLGKFGGEIDVALGLGFTLSGGYTVFHYDLSGDAQAYGARLDWAHKATTAGGGYRIVHGDLARDRYQQASLSATQAFGPLRLSAGAERLEYETPINRGKIATTGTLGLSYNATRSLELSASAEYGKTPEFDREVKGLLAVLWHYAATAKKGADKR